MEPIQARVFPDPEHGPLLIGSDDDEEEVVQQRTHSRWGRTAVALLVVGLVATVLVVGTVHDKMVPADAAHAQQKWGFSDAWEAASSAASSVSDAASNVDLGAIGDHAQNIASQASTHAQNAVDAVGGIDLGEHAQNAVGAAGDAYNANLKDHVNTAKDAAGDAYNAAEGHVNNLNLGEHAQNAKDAAGDAYNAALGHGQAQVDNAQKQVCGVVMEKLPALKTRWVDKMSHDLFKSGNVCHTDFKSKECKDEFVDDACKDAGAQVVKDMCAYLFAPVVEKMVGNMDALMTNTATNLNESILVKNSLSLELLALDDKVKKFCYQTQ